LVPWAAFLRKAGVIERLAAIRGGGWQGPAEAGVWQVA